MILNDFEICSICGYQIPRYEQAFVFKGNIVCLECNNISRGKINTTEDIQNTQYNIKDTNINKGEKEMNSDTNINSSVKVNKQLRTLNKINISDLEHDKVFNETETVADYINSSDDFIEANLNVNCQQVKIQLPPIIQSYFINRNSSSLKSQLTKSYRAVGGFVILLCIIAIIVVGAVLATRYLI